MQHQCDIRDLALRTFRESAFRTSRDSALRNSRNSVLCASRDLAPLGTRRFTPLRTQCFAPLGTRCFVPLGIQCFVPPVTRHFVPLGTQRCECPTQSETCYALCLALQEKYEQTSSGEVLCILVMVAWEGWCNWHSSEETQEYAPPPPEPKITNRRAGFKTFFKLCQCCSGILWHVSWWAEPCVPAVFLYPLHFMPHPRSYSDYEIIVFLLTVQLITVDSQCIPARCKQQDRKPGCFLHCCYLLVY